MIELLDSPETQYTAVRELVLKGLEYDDDHDEVAILEKILKREAYLYKVGDKAVFITVPTYTPLRSKLYLYLAAGTDFREWSDEVLDVVEDQARDLGMDIVEIAGRKGWEKFIKPQGYEPESIIYRKKVE